MSIYLIYTIKSRKNSVSFLHNKFNKQFFRDFFVFSCLIEYIGSCIRFWRTRTVRNGLTYHDIIFPQSHWCDVYQLYVIARHGRSRIAQLPCRQWTVSRRRTLAVLQVLRVFDVSPQSSPNQIKLRLKPTWRFSDMNFSDLNDAHFFLSNK